MFLLLVFSQPLILTQGKLELYSGIVAASTLHTETVLAEGEEGSEKEEAVKDKSRTEV